MGKVQSLSCMNQRQPHQHLLTPPPALLTAPVGQCHSRQASRAVEQSVSQLSVIGKTHRIVACGHGKGAHTNWRLARLIGQVKSRF